MKIRHPLAVKMLGFAVACFVRLWIGLVGYRYRPLGPNLDPNQRGFRGQYLYAFWHENLLIPAYHYARHDLRVLISLHADGELIAEACRRLGVRLARGSTTRGGAEALLQMVKQVRSGETRHLAVTPDGPRGPRRRVQPGIVYLAARTGLPIVAAGIAFSGAWRMRSWDRFALPCPGSAAVCVTGEPIYVPETLTREQLEEYRLRVQDAFDRADEAAERLAGATPARQEVPARRAA